MRARALFPRLALGSIVGLIAAFVYRFLQDFGAGRAEIRSECWMWHWLPFDAWWLGPYLTMFVLVILPWLMLDEWRQVKRFAAILLSMAAVGWIVFMIYPTACVRPPPDGQPFVYAMLLWIDQADNCMPCLHSAFSVLTTGVLLTGSSAFRSVAGKFILGIWLLVICVSIVALRQHTDLDTLAGFALGCVGAGVFAAGQKVPNKFVRLEPKRPVICANSGRGTVLLDKL